MNGYIKNVILAAVLFGATAASAEVAQSGSCMSKAIALRASQKVTLVNEYDPELKDFYDMGVCYYKITLRKGTAYTIWINGGNSADMMMSVDVDWQQENSPFAMFDYMDYASGDKVAFMYADAWDEEDPASFVYYVAISGEIGDTCQLYYQTGIKSFTQVGEEDNPRRITVSDTQVNDSRDLIAGDYYYIVRLEAGRKYMFRTTGGSAQSSLSMSIDPFDYLQEEIPEYKDDQYNMSWYVYPSVTQDYVINISGGWDETTSFQLRYKAFPSRLPSKHSPKTQLTAEANYSATVIPGRTVANTDYYDPIIDEALCFIWLEAGEQWVFETSGATKKIRMVVYDYNGNVLVQNESMDNVGLDCRAGVTATSSGWHFVGVCRPDLEYWDAQPTEGEVVVRAYKAESVDAPDEYDPQDDVNSGAELLDVYPASPDNSVVEVGARSGVHMLNAGDWYDYFMFAGRKGTTYAFKASFAGFESTSLKLSARLYRKRDGVVTRITPVTTGSISPEGTDDVAAPLTFTADENALYFVRISVLEGVALDYPAYQLNAMAYRQVNGNYVELGLVRAKTKGVDGSWWIKDDASAVYPSGASVVLEADVQNAVRYAAESGYTRPSSVFVTPTVWTGYADSITEVTGVYNDEFDPGDDIEANAAQYAITPGKAVSSVKRTLWSEDESDYFRFKANPGYYYNFWIVDTTQDATGDAVFSINYAVDSLNGIYSDISNCVSFTKKAFDPRDNGKYNIRVYHGTSAKSDTSYKLYYQAVNVGTIQFANAAPGVRESSDYIDLTVKRSSSEGAVRVNYATVADTARPGKEYYPEAGVLSWADGDMSDRTIRINLIPDLIEEWDEMLVFYVKLWPMAEDSLAEDEYCATIAGDTAMVKIKEISSKDIPAEEDTPSAMPVGDDVISIAEFSSMLSQAEGVSISGSGTWYGGETPSVLGCVAPSAGGSVKLKCDVKGSGVLEARPVLRGSAGSLAYNIGATAWVPFKSGDLLKLPVAAAEGATTTVFFRLTDTDGATSVAFENFENGLPFKWLGLSEAGVSVASGNGEFDGNADGEFVSTKPAAGGTVKLKFTVKGSGVLEAKPVLRGGAGSLAYNIGATAWVPFNSGDLLRLPVAAAEGAATTVFFRLNGTSGATSLAFENLENGLPFKWLGLSEAGVSVASGNGEFDGNADGEFVSTKPAAGGTVKLKFTVKGSGVLEAKPVLRGGAGSLAYNIGATAWVPFNSGDLLRLPVAAADGAATTVFFRLDGTSGATSLAFENLENGLPFKWLGLSEAGVSVASGNGDFDGSAEGEFVSTKPAAGGTVKLKFTVKGSGVLEAKPVLRGGAGSLAYNIGATAWVPFNSGDLLKLPVAAAEGAATTVFFRLNGTSGATSLAFENFEDGLPFKWLSLSEEGITLSSGQTSFVGSTSDAICTTVAPSGQTLKIKVGVKGTGLLVVKPSVYGGASGSLAYNIGATAWVGFNSGDLLVLPVSASDKTVTTVFFRLTGSSGKEGIGFEMLDGGLPMRWIAGDAIRSFDGFADGTPKTIIPAGMYDSAGGEMKEGKPVYLAQGVACEWSVAAESGIPAGCIILDGALPEGLALDSAVGTIKGVPIVAGEYSVAVMMLRNGGVCKTLPLNIIVGEIGSASGSFSAAVQEIGGGLSDVFARIGRIGMTVSSKGAISATVKVAGSKYSFSAPNFDALYVDEDDPEPVVDGGPYPRTYMATLKGKTTIDGVEYTNTLELSIVSGRVGDKAILGSSAGSLKLTLNMLDADGLVKEVSYGGELIRDNSGSTLWLSAVTRFSGYYTVSLVPYGVGPQDGVPCGNGYLTLTLDENGTAKYAGLLADGTAVSGSSVVGLRGDPEFVETCSVVFPVGLYADPWSFGGMVKIDWATTSLDKDVAQLESDYDYTAPVVDSNSSLEWNKHGKSSSFDKQGFSLEIKPTGGYYNTVVNLQRYYLDREFTVKAQSVVGIPEGMLPGGYAYTAYTMPHGVDAYLKYNTLAAVSRGMVKTEDQLLWDLAASVNPWRVEISFVRATGLLSGTFRAWSDGATQSQFATLNHYGVLLMNRDAKSPLDDDVWTAGFYLMPVTSDWTFSLPFNIISVEVDRDWNELEPPVAE